VLEAENSKLKELYSENLRLKELLGVTEKTNLVGIAADVIGYSPSTWVRSLTLNKGALQGVARGMPVLVGSGVVGQISAAGATSSQVLLINDHTSGIDAIIQDSRTRGIVEGADDYLRFIYVSSDANVKIGDRVITSGMDTIFPKGMFIGVVSQANNRENSLFYDINVKPAVDFSRLETVLVVTTPVQVESFEEETILKDAKE
ncbi:MAG: rod shape-determining protein MreC, partial [Bdellovibrionales bacterium]|nr:rod shape-determining protein MreC [Bdellovibrionales bacterium]